MSDRPRRPKPMNTSVGGDTAALLVLLLVIVVVLSVAKSIA